MLLMGPTGCGRRSLSRLASYMCLGSQTGHRVLLGQRENGSERAELAGLCREAGVLGERLVVVVRMMMMEEEEGAMMMDVCELIQGRLPPGLYSREERVGR